MAYEAGGEDKLIIGGYGIGGRTGGETDKTIARKSYFKVYDS